MNNNTVIDDNWIIDYNFSNVIGLSEQDKLIIDSLKSSVKGEQCINNIVDSTRYYNIINKHSSINKLFETQNATINAPEIPINPLPKSKNYIFNLQNWVGYVSEIIYKESIFNAKLYDCLDNTTYEMAQFEFSDISQADLPLLQIGAIFYWSIGFEVENGQKSKKSLVRFKRSPNWTTNDIDYIVDKADDLYKSLTWD